MSVKRFSTNVLILSLLCYAAMAAVFSWIQADYICADFVAYSTIARRTIAEPWATVTSYWAPLYSWLMIPFFLMGVDDLVTGRLILVISGGVYLAAIHRLTVIHATGRVLTDHLIQVGTMTCAVLQATIWATYLLDPDLLANGFLYLYFCLVTAHSSRYPSGRSAVAAGVLAGFSYLAKAYMLPFCLLHFVLTMGLRLRTVSTSEGAQSRSLAVIRPLCGFLLGLAVIAGPWIATISLKSGHLCFSSAGAANHANMGPDAFRKDPLWHPGIQRDYIFEPGLNSRWSPIQDLAHFSHQMQVVHYNVMNCIGLIPVWLVVFVASLCVVLRCRFQSSVPCWWYVIWVAITCILYCGGYTTVNLEARYIVPTVVPLLCHATLIMAGGVASRVLNQSGSIAFPVTNPRVSRVLDYLTTRRSSWFVSRPLFTVAIIVSILSAVDIDNLIRVATRHPQAVRLQNLRIIARHYLASGLVPSPITCNDWHLGLYVLYSADQLPNYWGSPLSRNMTGLVNELDDHQMKVFLRFVRKTDPTSYFPFTDPFAESQDWTRQLTIRDERIEPDIVEVYVRR